MRGIAYGVGVGPGDPELMTFKAARLIRDNEVIAVPGKTAEDSVAYKIAFGAVPEIAEKTLVPVFMPMVRDRAKLTELVSGVTSFCAAAARLNIPLTEWNEPLHVIPASHNTKEPLNLPGTYVLMKSASHMKETKDILIASGRKTCCVENCGMENEKVYRSAEEIPDDAGYFSLVIVKETR